MVLRRIQDEIGLHKLNSRWEGPFIVTKVTGPGSYRLIYSDGLEILEHRASSEVLPISCQKASSRISNFNKETWSFGVQFEHPRQLQESLLHRLPRIPTFLCSLKVKGTANRVVGAKGHEPYGLGDKLSTFIRSCISINLSTTPVLDFWTGQGPYFSRGFHRPLDDNWSNTPVLDIWIGQAPYIPKGFSCP